MLSKWEWIASKLRKEGFRRLALKADRMEQCLKKLYDTTIAEGWILDLEDYEQEYINASDLFQKLYALSRVIGSTRSCIACSEDSSNVACSECKLKEAYGQCSHEDSVFRKFRNDFDNLLDAVQYNTPIEKWLEV